MDTITVLNLMLENWWSIGLTMVGCSLAAVFSWWLGLNKPFPLSIILGGIQTFMLVEVLPFVYLPGDWMTPGNGSTHLGQHGFDELLSTRTTV